MTKINSYKIVFVFWVILQCSCATSVVRISNSKGHIYPATKLDAYLIHNCFDGKKSSFIDGSNFLAFLCAVDMPFSLVFDTLIFPYDMACKYQSDKRRAEKNIKDNAKDPKTANEE